MSKYKKQIGAWGEETAAGWLIKRGYTVVARNVRTPYGEIDIVAQQSDVTVFVEVKTLTGSKNLLPEDNITARKREHMLNCAQHYAAEHEIDHWRIDVIAVEGKPADTPPVITHFENIA
jgi:putative endonuclease